MNLHLIIMLAAIIIFIVIPSLKERIIPAKKLVIAPLVFIYFFYQTLNTNFNIHIENIGTLLLGILTGILIGAIARKNTSIQADKNLRLIKISGSIISLFSFSLLFLIHFLMGYLKAINPNYLAQAYFGQQTFLFLLSAASCITLGANGVLFFKYLSSEPRSLS